MNVKPSKVWRFEWSEKGPKDLVQCLKIAQKVVLSNSTLRAKRATVTFLSEQKLLQNAKNGPFWQVFENLNLVVKQCYQTGHF